MHVHRFDMPKLHHNITSPYYLISRKLNIVLLLPWCRKSNHTVYSCKKIYCYKPNLLFSYLSPIVPGTVFMHRTDPMIVLCCCISCLGLPISIYFALLFKWKWASNKLITLWRLSISTYFCIHCHSNNIPVMIIKCIYFIVNVVYNLWKAGHLTVVNTCQNYCCCLCCVCVALVPAMNQLASL